MASRSPTTFLLLLRTIDMYVEKLEKPALFEDKRALRELQEVSVRVVDLCVKISADINGSLVVRLLALSLSVAVIGRAPSSDYRRAATSWIGRERA